MTDVAIIGGGASGLAAAVMIRQREPSLSVTVFEKNSRVGRKLSVTGNGRCNITNTGLYGERYHGDSELAARLLHDFSFEKQRGFFRTLGVLFTEEEDGRTYPFSFQAASVTDALRLSAGELGVQILTECPVGSVSRDARGFILDCSGRPVEASAVIVACGGKAGGNLGSMTGYDILRSLGHKILPLSPAIVQIRTETEIVRALKGVKVDGIVTLSAGSETRSDSGEILFTDYGISGPPVLQVSRLAQNIDVTAVLDLIPRMSEEEIILHLEEMVHLHPGRPVSEIFAGFINKRLGTVALKYAGADLKARSSELQHSAIRRTAHFLKHLSLKVTGTTGFENAQVTAGGADTSQFFDSLMSKKAKGLFAAGEVLNIDGDCGGFNLAYCWASANAVANGVINYLRDRNR